MIRPGALFVWLLVSASAVRGETVCTADLLCVFVQNGETIRLTLDNYSDKPLSFRLYLDDAVTVPDPGVLRLHGPQQRLLAEFPRPPRRWGFEFRVHYGFERRGHDDRHVYLLPFARDRGYLVSQSHTQLTTHHLGNRYAIDWAMPEGEPVHAARSGRVVSVYDGSDAHSDTGAATANHIWIEHDDGTIGKYLHLAYKGVLVGEGERVTAGQHVGHSGNTGFTRGPHLHFSVSTLDGEALYQTFNVRFSTSEGITTVVSGRTYRHPAEALLTARQP